MVNHAACTTTGFPEELPEGDPVQLRFALPSGDGCWLRQEHRVIVISTGQATEKFRWTDPVLHVQMYLSV